MHSVSEMGVNNVPAFLTKLWTLVEDPSTDELIAWDPSGQSFHVYDQARFAREILPFCFKHNNMASFIRQLNMYGFRKVVHIDSGAIKQEVEDVEFQHPFFIRGQEHQLEYIKRKTSGAGVTVKTEGGMKLNPEQVSTVLNDVNVIKGKQDSLSGKMDKMKKENEALWREVATLRQKHMKQQQIVNKLIQFMIHLVGGKRGLSTTSLPKRKMPLMISDSGQRTPTKRPRYSKQLSIEELANAEYIVKSPQSVGESTSSSPKGPIIHEVIDSPSSSSAINFSLPSDSKDMSRLHKPTITPQNGDLAVPSDISVPRDLSLDLSLDTADLSNLVDSSLMALPESSVSLLNANSLTNTLNPTNNFLRSSLSGELDTMQDDLNSLKDLLSGGHYNFDPSTVLQLFNSEEQQQQGTSSLDPTIDLFGALEKDPIALAHLVTTAASSSTSSTATNSNPDHNAIIGNELVQFQSPDTMFQQYPDLEDCISDDDLHTTENIDPMSFINMPPVNIPKVDESLD